MVNLLNDFINVKITNVDIHEIMKYFTVFDRLAWLKKESVRHVKGHHTLINLSKCVGK